MKGIIRIDTPIQTAQLTLDTLRPEEIYNKSHQLKETLEVRDFDKPFVVWMQLPSRMNNADFPDFDG